MSEGAADRTKRIRLTGSRFHDGLLPVDSLVELQRYQTAVRVLAAHEWLQDHPGEPLPEDFGKSLSLAIERIRPGSADIFLAFEQVGVYAEYQAEARDAIDATIQAAYAGTELPPLPEPVRDDVRWTIADLGQTLTPGQAIKFYVDQAGEPIEITTATRADAIDRLRLPDFFIEETGAVESSGVPPQETTVVAHITAIDAESKKFVAKDLDSQTILGRYGENPELLEDLRAAVDSQSQGPLTRITGELRFRGDKPWRFWKTYSIERVEFDDTDWGRTLTHLASLQMGWAEGAGQPISSVALDAAQTVLRAIVGVAPPPTIGPTEEGGVLLEWIESGAIRSIEILEDGSFELFEMAAKDRRGQQRITFDAREAASFARGTDG